MCNNCNIKEILLVLLEQRKILTERLSNEVYEGSYDGIRVIQNALDEFDKNYKFLFEELIKSKP